MKNIKYLFCLSLLLAMNNGVSAQAEMADALRADGKIYVVVAIILIVLTGLVLYLFLLDKKVRKLENLLNQKQRQTK